MRIGFHRHFAQLVDNVLRRRKIGVAHAKVNDVATRLAGCGAHVINFGDDIGRQTLDAVELFGHWTFSCRCCAGRALVFKPRLAYAERLRQVPFCLMKYALIPRGKAQAIHASHA